MEDRLKEAQGAADRLKRDRRGKKIKAEREKPGPEILLGRRAKKKLNGTESHQGEHRSRSPLLLKATRKAFYCDVELWKELKIRAYREDRPLSELLNILLREGLERRKQ